MQNSTPFSFSLLQITALDFPFYFLVKNNNLKFSKSFNFVVNEAKTKENIFKQQKLPKRRLMKIDIPPVNPKLFKISKTKLKPIFFCFSINACNYIFHQNFLFWEIFNLLGEKSFILNSNTQHLREWVTIIGLFFNFFQGRFLRNLDKKII